MLPLGDLADQHLILFLLLGHELRDYVVEGVEQQDVVEEELVLVVLLEQLFAGACQRELGGDGELDELWVGVIKEFDSHDLVDLAV